MVILSILKKIINRRVWLTVCFIIFSLSMVNCARGTFDEINVQRISFTVNPRYTYEVNLFFNRTMLNYAKTHSVAGYLFTPPPYYALLYINKTTGDFEGFPTIVWCHGGLGNAELQYHYAKELAARGFKVLAINQPGHGDSGGQYTKGINNLPVLYSAVDYLYYLCWDVDRNRIGVSGHSHGGVLTTRGGIFDNWTNPRTNNTIGTGGKIRSFGAIYCWDTLLGATIYMGLNERPLYALYPELLYYDPNFMWIFSRSNFLSNTFPFTMPNELEAHSVSNFINSSNIGNYMLIIGAAEEFISVPQECLLMEAATKNSSGIPQVSAEDIFTNVISKFSWDYGNITENTTRRLIIIPGVTHIEEGSDPIVLQSLVSWFHESFQTGYEGIPIRLDWQNNYNLRQSWFIGLFSALSAIPGLVSYLSSWLSPKLDISPESKKKNEFIPSIKPGDLELNKKIKLIVSYCLFMIISCITGAYLVRNVLDIKTFVQFWNWNLVSIPILVISLIQIPFLILIIKFEKKRYNLNSEDYKISPKSILRGLAIGALPLLLILCIYNISAFICNVPMLLPRPFEAVYIDFFILLGIMFLFSLTNELFFRKLIQSKIDKGKRKLMLWKNVFIISLINMIMLIFNFGTIANLTFGTGFFGHFAPLEATGPFLAILCGSMIVLSFVNAFIYQRSKSITSTSILTALILTLLQTGKLFGNYV
ncbi:MAG: alpha/beta hydrolase family protein [Candidatus Hodarchaeota archaeon]